MAPWSHGRMAAWPHGRMAAWPGAPPPLLAPAFAHVSVKLIVKFRVSGFLLLAPTPLAPEPFPQPSFLVEPLQWEHPAGKYLLPLAQDWS